MFVIMREDFSFAKRIGWDDMANPLDDRRDYFWTFSRDVTVFKDRKLAECILATLLVFEQFQAMVVEIPDSWPIVTKISRRANYQQ